VQARTIAIAGAVVAVACALVVAPLAAFGDESSTATPPAAVQQAAQVREDVEQVNEDARDDAPAAVGATCNRTLDVDGIGDACVTGDGLLRVEQADGRSHTIHGLDAPPVGEAASFAPASQTAMNGASAADISCVGSDAPHYTLVYARPGNVASRFDTIAPKLRTEVYKLSAFYDAETRAVDPTASNKLPVRCDAGSPVVLTATLSGLSNGSASFGDIVDGLVAQGYEYNGDHTGNERYIVYYDSASPSGAAGTGHVFTSDATAGATNQNNNGGLYAVEYNWAGGGGVPHWDMLIHEITHTMGAVVTVAPHTSGVDSRGVGVGHCTDGLDIMCYDDGGSLSSGYTTTACSTKVLDCNRDDYFNPKPAAGSFLATHWNVAASYNRFLVHGAAGDTSAPTDVVGLTQTGASNSTIGVAWSPSSDGSGSPSYVVSVRTPGGAWTNVATTTRRTATVTGLAPSTQYEVGVMARDAAANSSAQAVISASTSDRVDVTAPGAPGGLAARVTSTAVRLSWNDASDDVGVSRYELQRIDTSARSTRGRLPRAAGHTVQTSISLSTRGLTPGARYAFRVVARDDAGNRSAASTVTVRIARDRARPTVPGRPRARARTRSTITFAWGASRDNVGVTGYVVSQRVGRRWVRLRASISARAHAVRITRLRRHSRYTFRVQARDRAGNLSRASRAVTSSTR
jgi:chitodextrinase